jgi:CobQ-like glutamine amidotransferase family enzyme
MTGELTITHLYPKQMSLYGDRGNIVILQKRAQELFNLRLKVQNCAPGQDIDSDSKLIMLGGGQDYDQSKIMSDLLARKDQIQSLIKNGAFYLGICGGYQLAGQFYQTAAGRKLPGLHLLDFYTLTAPAGQKRIIGNIQAFSQPLGLLRGFENHGGRTFLGSGLKPLAQIKQGGGNNGQDQTEGVLNSCGQGWIMGTYLHGFLPKNPKVADFIIETISGQKPSILADNVLENLNHQCELT